MDDPNFYDICPHLAHGPNGLLPPDLSRHPMKMPCIDQEVTPESDVCCQGLGYTMTCPRDGRPHCSLVDALDDEHSGPLAS